MSSERSGGHLGTRGALHGKQTYLRPPRRDEISFIRALWGDPETMAPVGGPLEYTGAAAAAWFARMIDPGGPSDCYCLIFTRENTPVGEISFHHWDSADGRADLNVKVLASHRGHGLGKDALLTFLRFYFDRVGGRLMVDDVAADNRAGQRLLAACGFKHDGTTRGVSRMVMTRDMYEARGSAGDRAT